MMNNGNLGGFSQVAMDSVRQPPAMNRFLSSPSNGFQSYFPSLPSGGNFASPGQNSPQSLTLTFGGGSPSISYGNSAPQSFSFGGAAPSFQQSPFQQTFSLNPSQQSFNGYAGTPSNFNFPQNGNNVPFTITISSGKQFRKKRRGRVTRN